MTPFQKTCQLYNGLARVYDFCLNWLFSPARQKVSELVGKHNHKSLLDVGCGTGELYKYDVSNYFGIDPSEGMLKVAKKKYPQAKFSNIALSELHEKYDVVTLLYVVSVVPDLPKLLKEVEAVLAKDGKVIVVNYFSKHLIFNSLLDRLPIFTGFKHNFPFSPFLFEPYFKITHQENVNLLGKWMLLILERK